MKTKTNGKRQKSLASVSGSVALCATCKHYCGLKADEYGKCRRYPPTLSPLYGNSEYPNVGVNMTCGEYAPQNVEVSGGVSSASTAKRNGDGQ